ncbi:hypothetical protein V8E54_003792 [Elaphomyces granulatus]
MSPKEFLDILNCLNCSTRRGNCARTTHWAAVVTDYKNYVQGLTLSAAILNRRDDPTVQGHRLIIYPAIPTANLLLKLDMEDIQFRSDPRLLAENMHMERMQELEKETIATQLVDNYKSRI